MSRRFSDRQGYAPEDAEITVREDAPDDLRFALPQIAMSTGMTPKALREVVCQALFVAPDENNWSAPNVKQEVQDLLGACPWFKVYDVAEALYERLLSYSASADDFRDRLNRFFREKGIGWELTDTDGIIFRGSETFRAATIEAAKILQESGRSVAANEIHEALMDISRRPEPDRTGAIQHAMAALECTARDVTGKPNATLGALLPKLDLPKPLDSAVDKLWGFASDRARHLREGQNVGDLEAELVVSVACAVSAFLVKRMDRVQRG
jgi:hypothetical protein